MSLQVTKSHNKCKYSKYHFNGYFGPWFHKLNSNVDYRSDMCQNNQHPRYRYPVFILRKAFQNRHQQSKFTVKLHRRPGDVLVIYRKFCLIHTKYIPFYSSYRNFSIIEHIIGHKTSLERIEIIHCILWDNKGIKVETPAGDITEITHMFNDWTIHLRRSSRSLHKSRKKI